jgi:hypothetical protein
MLSPDPGNTADNEEHDMHVRRVKSTANDKDRMSEEDHSDSDLDEAESECSRSTDGHADRRYMLDVDHACPSTSPGRVQSPTTTTSASAGLQTATTSGRQTGCDDERPSDDSRAVTPASLGGGTRAGSMYDVASLGTPSMGVDWSSGQFRLECAHHATGIIDDVWAMCVQEVAVDTDGHATAHATLIYTQLYRVSRVRILCCSRIDVSGIM